MLQIDGGGGLWSRGKTKTPTGWIGVQCRGGTRHSQKIPRGRLGNRSVRTPTRKVSTLPPPSHALRNQTVGYRAKSQGVTLVANEALKGLSKKLPEGFWVLLLQHMVSGRSMEGTCSSS